METSCMDGQCLKNYLQTALNRKKNTYESNENFMKTMMKIVIKAGCRC